MLNKSLSRKDLSKDVGNINMRKSLTPDIEMRQSFLFSLDGGNAGGNSNANGNGSATGNTIQISPKRGSNILNINKTTTITPDITLSTTNMNIINNLSAEENFEFEVLENTNYSRAATYEENIEDGEKSSVLGKKGEVGGEGIEGEE